MFPGSAIRDWGDDRPEWQIAGMVVRVAAVAKWGVFPALSGKPLNPAQLHTATQLHRTGKCNGRCNDF